MHIIESEKQTATIAVDSEMIFCQRVKTRLSHVIDKDPPNLGY
jgi:hypothetical protein